MESMALASSSSSKSLLGYTFGGSSQKNPIGDFTIRRINPSPTSGFPSSIRGSKVTFRCSRIYASSQSQSSSPSARQNALVKSGFASVSSSKGEQTSLVGYPNTAVPPPSSSFGSPLFWIGVGVGLSALFSWGTSSLKKFAMQQTMKTLMNQMNTQNNQFSNPGFPSGSPFPFPTPSQTSPSSSPFQAAPQPSVTVDVSATKVEAPPARNVDPAPSTKAETASTAGVKEEGKSGKKENNYAFVDVSPEETTQETPFSNYEEVPETSSSKNTQFFNDVLQNGAASKQGAGASAGFESSGTGKGGPGLSVEALEKMMEDPNVQKMVYPYLPEEMRNPQSFKWMMQNPQYRQQLQDMLNNMGGSGEWDPRMVDTLKQFDLNSPEVKQQFNEIGLTPEEVISKVMANPDVAVAFQNPRVQAALMDCSQNPMNIMKYQNDKEIMDVFNKISQLFPGMSGGM